MATAWAQGCFGFSVYTRPWITMISAGLTTRPCAFAVLAMPRRIAKTGSTVMLKRFFISVRSLFVTCLSKCGWRVDPQHPGFRAPRIPPAMRNRAFKIKAVAGFQTVMLALVQPDFKISAKHVQKFLSLVRVRFAAASAGFHTKKMRLHGGIAPGQQFHANIRRGFENFPFRWPDQALMFAGGLEECKDVRAIELSDAAQRCHRRTHLPSF